MDECRVSANSGMSAKASRSGIGSSLSRSMVDPRSVRIQRILASNVLDMKVERATFLNILPSTKYDLYLNEIRSADAKLKQMGVPTDLEIREIEVNTDEILTSDKEVQFCDGDDTKFLNTLSAIKQKKRKEKAETKDVGIQDTRREIQERHDAGSGSQLSEFLRKSSLAIESLLTESRQQKASSKPEDRDFKMLSEKLPWKEAGRDGKNGANELLRNRSTSLIKFSEYQTDVFLTIHPFSDSDSEDLRPFKVRIRSQFAKRQLSSLPPLFVDPDRHLAYRKLRWTSIHFGRIRRYMLCLLLFDSVTFHSGRYQRWLLIFMGLARAILKPSRQVQCDHFAIPLDLVVMISFFFAEIPLT